MLSSERKKVLILPYWPDYLFGILFFLAGTYLLVKYSGVDATGHSRLVFGGNILAVLGILVFVKASFFWEISEKGITVYFILIPVRRILWNQVDTAEYIYKWSNGVITEKGQGIFITLKGCPCFSPEVDALDLFQLKNPFGSLFMRFTPTHQKRYIETFQHYFPNLEFQIGSEGNLKEGKS